MGAIPSKFSVPNIQLCWFLEHEPQMEAAFGGGRCTNFSPTHPRPPKSLQVLPLCAQDRLQRLFKKNESKKIVPFYGDAEANEPKPLIRQPAQTGKKILQWLPEDVPKQGSFAVKKEANFPKQLLSKRGSPPAAA